MQPPAAIPWHDQQPLIELQIHERLAHRGAQLQGIGPRDLRADPLDIVGSGLVLW
ncbi:MAG: hypothetical protein ACO3B3_09330 [Cyanobium sp.]